MAIRTILLPTDFSDSANAALDWAKDLAAAFEARIVLLHVVDLQYQMMPSGLLVVPTPIPASVVRRAHTQAAAALDAAAANVPAVERRLVRKGHARDVTLAVADEVKADVIVMGTHGRRGVEHLFIGSVAEYVVRHARVPVMTVRAAAPNAGRRSPARRRSLSRRRSP
jgi:universal stress protein A